MGPQALDDGTDFKPMHVGRVFVGDYIQTEDGLVWTVDALEVVYRLKLATIGREPCELLVPFASPGNEVLHRKGPRLDRGVA